MNIYSAPPTPAPPSGPGLLAGLAPDLRRDPREALRDMRLTGRPLQLIAGRTAETPLQDDVLSDPYEDTPGTSGRRFSVLRRPQGDVCVLLIPDWIADNASLVGALDEMRYGFRGKVVRMISEGVDAPSFGLGRLITTWRQDQIDAAFVAWRYVEELGSGRHQLPEVLQFPAAPPPPAWAPGAAALPVAPPAVFISYAHDDADWYARLLQMLGPVRRNYKGAIWHDGLIPAGSNWSTEIGTALASAQIVVLMVTPAFLASEFIHANELTPTLQAVAAGRKKLLWVYVKPCAFQAAGIGQYQAAHDIAEPIEALSPSDQGKQLLAVTDKLAAALEALAAGSARPLLP